MAFVEERAKEILQILTPEDRRILLENFEQRVFEAKKERPVSDFGRVFGAIFGAFFGLCFGITLLKWVDTRYLPEPCPAPIECPKRDSLTWSRMNTNAGLIFYGQAEGYTCLQLENADSFFCDRKAAPPETLPIEQ